MSNKFQEQILCRINSNNTTFEFDFLLTDQEKKLISILSRIYEKYRCLDPDVIPYNDFPEDVTFYVDILKELAEQSTNKEISSKIYDFLWIIKKDQSVVQNAITGFCAVISENIVEYPLKTAYFMRIVKMHKQIKNKDNKNIIKTASFSILNDSSAIHHNSTEVLKIVKDEHFLSNDELIEVIKQKMSFFNNIDQFHQYISLSNILEGVIRDKYNLKGKKPRKNDDALKKVLFDRAQKYLDLVHTKNTFPLRQQQDIKEAIAILKLLPNTTEKLKELTSELNEINKKVSNSLTKLSIDFDLDEEIQKIQFKMDLLSDHEAFCYFLCSINLFCEEEIITIINESYNENLLLNKTPIILLSKDGAQSAVLPPIDNPNDIAARGINLCGKLYALYGQTIIAMLNMLNKRNINFEAEVNLLINDNVFVPVDRKIAFFRGIMAGINHDFITSLSILAPQLENSIRKLTLLCGGNVIKMNAENIEEVLSLTTLLKGEELENCIFNEIIYSLDVIFTSEYGFNLRNEVAHGKIDDQYFNTSSVVFAWWLIMRLCFEFHIDRFNIIKKISCKLTEATNTISSEYQN